MELHAMLTRIFKIQVTHLSNDPRKTKYGMTLVYSKGRLIMGEWGTTKEEAEFMKGRPKAYFNGVTIPSASSEYTIKLIDEAPTQPW
jgi:hypothetical protein